MFVVTLPSSASKQLQTFAERAKAAGADVLEIRGDLTPDISPFESPLPFLISPRGTGSKLLKNLNPSFIDLELNETVEIPNDITVIRSFHNHEKTPPLAELQKIAATMLATKPDILKIATMIRSYDDLRTLDALQKEIPSSQKRIILGMGPKAHLNRMLSPLKNALTYSFIDHGEESAPGQVSLSMYKLTAHCKNPKIFGTLGGVQVSQSLSPVIHNWLFHRHGIDALYCAFPTDDLRDAWTALAEMNVSGFSVTSPFKESIIPFLDDVEGEAAAIRSVNTVIRKGLRSVGMNTDVAGLQSGYDWNGIRSVAILGSGGVVPAVIACCAGNGITDITIYSRNAEKREMLAARHHLHTEPLEGLKRSNPDRIICTISEDIDVDLPDATTGSSAIDLRYGRLTKFLAATKKRGWQTADGLPMLITQALEQFRLFTDISSTKEDALEIERTLSLPRTVS